MPSIRDIKNANFLSLRNVLLRNTVSTNKSRKRGMVLCPQCLSWEGGREDKQ